MTRRDAIVSAAAVGGGLLLATCMPRLPPAKIAANSPAPSTGDELHAYLHIASSGDVTVTVPASEMGQGTTTALPMVLCEELDCAWDRVRFEQAPPAAIYGGMVTEASATTRGYFPILHTVGATARAMLITVAARRWGVDARECTSDQGDVVHAASKRRLSYGALSLDAATIAVPANVPLKARQSFRLAGRATPFIDLQSKLDGSAVYGLDVRLPEMLVGAIRHCPRFGARVGSVDARVARGMPGVQGIVELEDAVVAVADSYWHAKRAVDAIDLTTIGGINTDDAEIGKSLEDALATAGAFGTGTVIDPFAHDVPTIDAIYRFPYLAHATMEPMNCTALVRDGRCTIWAPTQGRRVAQAIAARVTGFSIERVEVHTTYLGGGFGRRSKNDFVEQTVRVALRLRRPVKLIWSREEDIAHDSYRPAAAVRIRAGLRAGGVALEARIAAPSLLAAYLPETFGSTTYDEIALEGVSDTPYAFGALRTSFTRVEPGVPIWFWRSVGNSYNTYAVECALDEVARVSGMDGVALRRRLLVTKPRELAVLERVLQLADSKRTPGTTLGVAFARMRQTTLAAVVEVSMASPTRVRMHRISCAVDCGLVVNPLSAEAQIQGGIVWGLSAAVWGDVSIAHGQAVQTNFDSYPVARIAHIPPTDVAFMQGGTAPGGLGEVGAGVIAPALANAIRAAGGPSIRTLPFVRSGITIERA